MPSLAERLAAQGTTIEQRRSDIRAARQQGVTNLQDAGPALGYSKSSQKVKIVLPKRVAPITEQDIASLERSRGGILGAAKSVWQGMTPWEEEKGQKATAKGVGIMAAELLIPGVYTARHWNDMSTGEKAFSIAMDAISLIPTATAAARGAKTVQTAGKAARLKGALLGVKGDIISQVRAPVDMILHPIETTKGTVKQTRSLIEDIAHPSKIPEAVLTTTDQTVRLKITKDMTPEKAMAARDELMGLVARGEKPVVQIGDTSVELGRSPFMKEVGGGVVHATPQGKNFTSGLKVTEKVDKSGRVMPLSEQGLFVANEPLPRFAEKSAFGMTGEAPTIIVMSKDVAKNAIPSGKTYRSHLGMVSEMELKLPIGAEIPAPKQKLFTRYGASQQKIEIFLDKPLSKAQILKLKGMATVENLKAPFQPSIKLTKGSKSDVASMTDTMMDDLVSILKKSGNKDQARALSLSRDVTKANRSVPKSLEELSGRTSTKTKDETVKAETTESSDRAEDTTTTTDGRSAVESRDTRRQAVETVNTDTITTRPEDREDDQRRDDREDDQRRDDREDDQRRDDREDDRRRDDREDDRRRDDRREDRRRDDRRGREEDDERSRRADRRSSETGTSRTGKGDDDDKKSKLGLPSGKGKLPGKKEYTSADVAHKQGMGWWIYKAPYRADDREFSMTKPKGATITKDAKTAFQTIQSLGGPVDLNEVYDMGIMDVHIGSAESSPSAKKGRTAIKFTRDKDMTYGRLKKNQKPPVQPGTTKKTKRKSKKVGPYYRAPGGGISRNPIE